MTGGLILTGAVAWFMFSQEVIFRTIVGILSLYFGMIIGDLVLVSILISQIMIIRNLTATGYFVSFAVLNKMSLLALAF